MSAKEFKVVLAGAFGSGRTSFASSIVQAKKDSKKIRKFVLYPSLNPKCFRASEEKDIVVANEIF